MERYIQLENFLPYLKYWYRFKKLFEIHESLDNQISAFLEFRMPH